MCVHLNMPPKRSYDVDFKLSAVNFAKDSSVEAAARHYGVDPKRIREWRTQKDRLESLQTEKRAKRKRLDGGGSKKVSKELEERVFAWIMQQSNNSVHVSRNMIRAKAKEIFDKEIDESKRKETFVASRGWLENFMKRHSLSL